ncbi:MAG: GNAT family protein [Alphaproteobacteria bacterium]
MVLRILRSWSGQASNLRLEGDQVYLRPIQDRDWRAWSEIRRDSRAFLEPWEPLWPPDALSRLTFRRRLDQAMDELRSETAYPLHIMRRNDDQLLGGVTMSNVRRGVAQSATLGYWIGEPFARKGHMTDALHCVAVFAFDRVGLHRLEAACLPSNEPSRRVLQKVGFQQEGYARGYLRINGHWHDHLLFGLLADDWRRRRERR